jgi:hypothetical protein
MIVLKLRIPWWYGLPVIVDSFAVGHIRWYYLPLASISSFSEVYPYNTALVISLNYTSRLHHEVYWRILFSEVSVTHNLHLNDLLSGPFLSTCPLWVTLPGSYVPASITPRTIRVSKSHHVKVILVAPGRFKNFLFSTWSKPALGVQPTSFPMGTGSAFPGGKAAGAWSSPLTSS